MISRARLRAGAIAVLAIALAVAPSKAAALVCSLCGDVNGDGAVDIVDALFVAQTTVGLRGDLDCPAEADVNGKAEAQQTSRQPLEGQVTQAPPPPVTDPVERVRDK